MVDASDHLMTMCVYPPSSFPPCHASNQHAQHPLIKRGIAICHHNVLCTTKSTADIYIQPISEVKNYATISPKPAGDRQTPPTPRSKNRTNKISMYTQYRADQLSSSAGSPHLSCALSRQHTLLQPTHRHRPLYSPGHTRRPRAPHATRRRRLLASLRRRRRRHLRFGRCNS